MTPKFRAWTEEGKVMYYDVFPFKDDTLLLSYDEIAFDEVPASDFILMQSTGLFDKNGEEIFEGDIIKYKKYNYGFIYTGVVGYDTIGLMKKDDEIGLISTFVGMSIKNIDLGSVKVVGNIYENPELLGE
nr:MAG TPA: YopX protein [Caudoviricetes sp.]